MAFLKIDKTKSRHYLRIVQAYRKVGNPNQRTLYSLGKVEDYSSSQLEKLAILS